MKEERRRREEGREDY